VGFEAEGCFVGKNMLKLGSKITILLFAFAISNVLAQSSAISLVPDKSVAVLRVNWSQVRGNENLKRIVNGNSFSKVANQIGLSEAKVNEWVVFSDINPTSANGLGMIVAGDFTLPGVIQNAKERGWKTETLGKNTAYLNPSDNTYLLPIRQGLLAVGTKKGIEKLQGAMANPKVNLISKPPFNSMWAELSANRQPISFIVGIPQGFEKIAGIALKVSAKLLNLASFGILGTIMETIGLVRSVGFTVSPNQAVFPTKLVAMLEDEGTAWMVSGAVNLLKKAAAFGLSAKTDAQRQNQAALQTLSVNYRENLLLVKFEMPINTFISNR
jgi:hypothetical protein